MEIEALGKLIEDNARDSIQRDMRNVTDAIARFILNDPELLDVIQRMGYESAHDIPTIERRMHDIYFVLRRDMIHRKDLKEIADKVHAAWVRKREDDLARQMCTAADVKIKEG